MIVEKVQFYDTLTLDAPRRTQDGYLAATAVVARTGIQKYRGREVGRPDLEWVRVLRPETEVFHKDALKSFAHRPVTNDHPPVPVTSENWKKYAVGQTGDEVVRDGSVVKVPMVLMDAAIIRDYEAGKREISQGYTTDLKWEPGEHEGVAYDAVQTEIRANHTAVVDAARGGPEVRIIDDNREKERRMKIITVDGLSVQVEDRDAEIIQRHVKVLGDSVASVTTQLADAKKALGDQVATLTTQLADAKKATETKDAEIATLKQQLKDAAVTPARLDSLVKDREQVISRAKVMLGDKLVVDGKTESEIKRQVVLARVGDAAKDWSEDQITASFNTLAASQSEDGKTVDQLADALSTRQQTDAREKSYDEYDKRLQESWKPKVAA